MSGVEHMFHVRQIQESALAETNAKIDACRASMKNFEHVSERIATLPDKLSHEVMVPFGKLAFMPGRLVHTNELLVHLGDAWFASMTCKKALQVVELRQKELGNTLSDLQKVSDNIKMKGQYLDEMKNAAEGNEFEIKEECPEAYTHPKDRRRVSKIKDGKSGGSRTLEEAKASKPKDVKEEKHRALMARLDELERLEEEEDELCRNSDSDKNEEYVDSDDSSSSREKPLATKHVKFKEDKQSDGNKEPSPVPCTIKFKHTKVDVKKTDDMTPADVFKLVNTRPKSILKPVSDKPVSEKSHRAEIPHSTVKLKETTAVSDVIVERRTVSAENPPSTDNAPSKPISKFKAARMKR